MEAKGFCEQNIMTSYHFTTNVMKRCVSTAQFTQLVFVHLEVLLWGNLDKKMRDLFFSFFSFGFLTFPTWEIMQEDYSELQKRSLISSVLCTGVLQAEQRSSREPLQPEEKRRGGVPQVEVHDQRERHHHSLLHAGFSATLPLPALEDAFRNWPHQPDWLQVSRRRPAVMMKSR